jgi:hypothetical protein
MPAFCSQEISFRAITSNDHAIFADRQIFLYLILSICFYLFFYMVNEGLISLEPKNDPAFITGSAISAALQELFAEHCPTSRARH